MEQGKPISRTGLIHESECISAIGECDPKWTAVKDAKILYGGGSSLRKLHRSELSSARGLDQQLLALSNTHYEIYKIVTKGSLDSMTQGIPNLIICTLPLSDFIYKLDVDDLRALWTIHGLKEGKHQLKRVLQEGLVDHRCSSECVMPVLLLRAYNLNGVPDIEDEEFINNCKKFSSALIPDISASGISPEEKVELVRVRRVLGDSIALVEGEVPIYNLIPETLVGLLTSVGLRSWADAHAINSGPRTTKARHIQSILTHICTPSCPKLCFIFRVVPCNTIVRNRDAAREPVLKPCSEPFVWDNYVATSRATFPPPPISMKDIAQVMDGYCEELAPAVLEESGCAVCGQLSQTTKMVPLYDLDPYLHLLVDPSSTRAERLTRSDPIISINGPVLARDLNMVCEICSQTLKAGNRPRLSLANGLWLGDIPDVLRDLTLAEQALISRVRYNHCLVRVANGHSKMIANVIAFEQPSLKMYQKLPVSRKELDQVLAVLFTGHKPPSDEDLGRTPVLVRRNRVQMALEWLKLNNAQYADLEIDYPTLNTYPLSGVPVEVVYKQTSVDAGNVLPSMKSQFDNDDERGTERGPCPFTVHGLTADDHTQMSTLQRKTAGIQHLKQGRSMLAVGHAEDPESIFGDVDLLYPRMFPWIFPYGMGGHGQARHKRVINKEKHIRCWLMYYDKRFQKESNLLIVMLNHQLIRQSSAKSFIMIKRRNFEQIAQTIREVEPNVLQDISERLKAGGRFGPQTPEEQKCFRLLDQIEYVGSSVDGSMAKKKYRRNELWSLLTFTGAPIWFVTITPSDNKHPLCLYWASEDIMFKPEIKGYAEREHLVTRNPVACARFFDYLVKLFIKHICGWHEEGPTQGAFGKPSAYYGMVEQQGRMTLHLHFLLWVEGCLPLQDVRDRLMSQDSDFTRELLQYLESCQVGDFHTGDMGDVQARAHALQAGDGESDITAIHNVTTINTVSNIAASLDTVDRSCTYVDPTLTFPDPPPKLVCCNDETCSCGACEEFRSWCNSFWLTTDDIICRSNVHRCYAKKDNSGKRSTQKSGLPKQHPTGKGCVDENGICTARFPRALFKESTVDISTGHVNLKKKEEWINTVTPIVSALNRCNSDTTCLLSGTAVKATIGYVTDYVTKSSLRTHQLFSIMYDTYTKNSDVVNNEEEPTNSARKIVVKMVNGLSAKSEIGTPYAALVLLGNPDHYTSHVFVSFFWKGFFNYVQSQWKLLLDNADGAILIDIEVSKNIEVSMDVDPQVDIDYSNVEENENVTLSNSRGQFLAKSSTDDYRLRPQEHANVCLYEWIQCAVRLNRQGSRTSNSHLSYFEYQPEHPLHEKYLVACDPDRRKNIVPNFIGPPLPRRDVGDYEEYCCVMLTFFCPWRSGIDLKSASESWKDKFEAFDFTVRHRELMNNFNLKYECYDARDDFAANRAAAATTNDESHPMYDLGATERDERGDWVAGDNDGLEDFDENGNVVVEGPIMHRLNEDNQKALNVLKQAGWDYSPFNPDARLQLPAVPPQHRDSSAWECFIKKESARLWKAKFATLDVLPNAGSTKLRYKFPSVRNDAWVIPPSYLSSTYTPVDGHWKDVMDEVVDKFTLNEEQDRAFRIIANHSTNISPDQLLMHLGGMGGTGKSCVIHALVNYFNRRDELYRFILLGPTGTSAALIGGSTYHSFLGFGRSPRHKAGRDPSLEDLRERLRGVEYILLDEMSMVSCEHLAMISSRLAAATQRPEAFGGLNVILAGDFAQLPPVNGKPLYTRNISMLRTARTKLPQESNALGKHYWLQFTCVVILKQNMRQLGDSPRERAFRRALENLRYKACTQEDIDLLLSRVAEINPGLRLDDVPWRNVSIITARNCDKDLFNDVHAIRFANEVGELLHEFYSEDRLVGSSPAKGKRAAKQARALERSDQEGLWMQSPDTSEQVAASLKLCLGMPVMVRYNQATELCITRGQEGRVIGWTCRAIKGYPNRKRLDVLFVELINPPKTVKIEKLPDNVVPITCRSQAIDARLPCDRVLRVSRTQVPILPNFGMTDYASQGKGRLVNVVDIARCKSFQGVYTCLSRGLTLDGTLIVRRFLPSQVTGQLDGALRQEFRDLNYLDLITKLWFKGELPTEIIGETRQDTIDNYRAWRQQDEERDWHPIIRGKDESPIFEGIKKPGRLSSDRINTVKSAGSVVQKLPQGNIATDLTFSKRSRCTEDVTGAAVEPPWKKVRYTGNDSDDYEILQRPHRSINVGTMTGPTWDEANWSCAYDAWTFVLGSILSDHAQSANNILQKYSLPMSICLNALSMIDNKQITPTDARDAWRNFMMTAYPSSYVAGKGGTDIIQLTRDLLGCDLETPTGVAVVCAQCLHCRTMSSFGIAPLDRYNCVSRGGSISEEVKVRLSVVGKCTCGGDAYIAQKHSQLLCFEVIRNQGCPAITLDTHLEIGAWGIYDLVGVIYYGDFHFVSRVISQVGAVFGHDGMKGAEGIYHGNMVGSQACDLGSWPGYRPCLAVYIERQVGGRKGERKAG